LEVDNKLSRTVVIETNEYLGHLTADRYSMRLTFSIARALASPRDNFTSVAQSDRASVKTYAHLGTKFMWSNMVECS
jgi:hypothetical protein